MAEVEKKPPGLPEEVPKELRMELERLQRQIKVLLNNYQVRESPEKRHQPWYLPTILFSPIRRIYFVEMKKT